MIDLKSKPGKPNLVISYPKLFLVLLDFLLIGAILGLLILSILRVL